MLGEDGLPVPSAKMCANFLRAHSKYLMEAKAELPYVNSAGAISKINDTAADLLDGSGAVRLAQREERLTIALLGLVGRWQDNKGVVEQEFIDRARNALANR